MQFIPNGPDIPDVLLDAHEEGDVVFFCGSGISVGAGLPGFKDLVDKIYEHLGTSKEKIEEKAYNEGRYDITLDLLERRFPGKRKAVRKALFEILQPKLRRRGARDIHIALLQLARTNNSTLQLVTTNFDRIFESISRSRIHRQDLKAVVAPMLPIPKKSKWDGLVYLHGLLPETAEDEASLNRLVLTSGDFGLAYLTEGWAARFVSELLRNFIVCFVGYSIEDPVLRYMMDALAADRQLGESVLPAYAFAPFDPGNEEAAEEEWLAKGVTPILYNKASNHDALRESLKAWAKIYDDGLLGKEQIVTRYALAHPTQSTKEDDFVGRMLWVLSDPTGLPAKCFAHFNPVPPLDWLNAFEEPRYGIHDLFRFGVAVGPKEKKEAEEEKDETKRLSFSLINRPSSYRHAPWMSLVGDGLIQSIRPDEVLKHLAEWLTRHLNDPALILWVAERGGKLNYYLLWLIDRRLEDITRLEKEEKTSELEIIANNAPNAIPDPFMKTLWRLMLIDRVKLKRRRLDLDSWGKRLEQDGPTLILRLELRDLLEPKIKLKKPLPSFLTSNDEEGTNSQQAVDWEIVLASDEVHYFLKDLKKLEQWQEFLPILLPDFQQLLIDALDLMRELEGANNTYDRSYFDLPSITPHWQNRGFYDWVVLIELLRDSWLRVLETDHKKATQIAQDWFDVPYPTFKRMALFAASQEGCIPASKWVGWLTENDAWWLWSITTRREVMRLFVLQGKELNEEASKRLEKALLAGPPRRMYRDDVSSEDWQWIVDRGIWLRLKKLEQGGHKLGRDASKKFKDLEAAHPEWSLSKYEKEEFSHWMSGRGAPDYEEGRKVDTPPTKRKELVKWLRESEPKHNDGWRDVCKKHFANASAALLDLSREGFWPVERWGTAFQAWSQNSVAKKTWKCLSNTIAKIPDDKFQELGHPLTFWLRKVSEQKIEEKEDIFIKICQRVLSLPYESEEPSKEPIQRAINHPVGHVTEAILNLLFHRKPQDNEGLPQDIKPIFSMLCDSSKDHFRHGRVILASRLIPLFRIDRKWTKRHLLPLFDWRKNKTEARAAWAGFLWSPRIYQPLLCEIKDAFLDTANHYEELGGLGAQYAALLTSAALLAPFDFKREDFERAIKALPQEGLDEVDRNLAQSLEAAADKREKYWENRIRPFWHDIWPKSRNLASKKISESLARLAVAAGTKFPEALSEVEGWLQPLEHTYLIVGRLLESGLIRAFPKDALKLLSSIVDVRSWPPRKLKECLLAISEASPSLKEAPEYKRLETYLRQQGLM